MKTKNWLIIIGALLLVVGLASALFSNHYTTRVMGEARKGVAVLAPEPNAPEWKEKEKLLRQADYWFYAGVVLTGTGIIMQTVGSVLVADAPLLQSRSNFRQQ